jgi:hypothetical protein
MASSQFSDEIGNLNEKSHGFWSLPVARGIVLAEPKY